MQVQCNVDCPQFSSGLKSTLVLFYALYLVGCFSIKIFYEKHTFSVNKIDEHENNYLRGLTDNGQNGYLKYCSIYFHRSTERHAYNACCILYL